MYVLACPNVAGGSEGGGGALRPSSPAVLLRKHFLRPKAASGLV